MKKADALVEAYLPGRLAANPWALIALFPLLTLFRMITFYADSGKSFLLVFDVVLASGVVFTASTLLMYEAMIWRFKIMTAARLGTIYVTSGVAQSAVIIVGLGIEWRAPGSGTSAWIVMFVGSFIDAAWLFMGHLAFALVTRSLRTYNELTHKNEELRLLTGSAQEELAAYKSSLQKAISERIQLVLDLISSKLAELTESTDPKSILETAKTVRELSEQDVRRLSHELSDNNEEPVTTAINLKKSSWRSFFRVSTDPTANFRWVVPVGTLQAVSLALAIGDGITALIVVVAIGIGFAAMILVDKLRIFLVRGWPLWMRLLSVPGEYVVMTTLGVMAVRSVTQNNPSVADHWNVFAFAVPIGAVSIWTFIFIIRGFSANVQLRSSQLAVVSAELESTFERLRYELRAVRNRLARVLHGAVQGRLASVSLALTATASADNPVTGRELINRAKSQLELVRLDLIDAFSEEGPIHDFDEALRLLLDGWIGLVAVDIALPTETREALQANSDLSQTVIHAMQECLTNAVRHGAAREIKFEFCSDAESMTMSALNDGNEAKADFVPGLGWRHMLAEASSIDMREHETGFEVRLSWRFN